jgi:exopolysaccharide/PEP-CTERM locus tyrosine autokinase
MSVVERALRKIQGAAGQAKAAEPHRLPVARAVRESARKAAEGGVSAPAAELADAPPFSGAASGYAIDFDFDALAAAGMLAPGNERLADEYRTIKQPILKKAAKSEGAERNRLVMVASALPGEGKTFTSVNLSLSLAREKNWSVLLVDADCRNPSLSRLLGVSEQPGLIDFLQTPDADLRSFVLPTNVDGLFVLPVGRSDGQAAEWLGSDRMKSLCATLASGAYGSLVAVFDSSPLLLTPEPVIVSQEVGQVVVVVHAERTSRPAVAEALSKLDDKKAIGLVLNQASAASDLASYGYGYRYGGYGRAEAAN